MIINQKKNRPERADLHNVKRALLAGPFAVSGLDFRNPTHHAAKLPRNWRWRSLSRWGVVTGRQYGPILGCLLRTGPLGDRALPPPYTASPRPLATDPVRRRSISRTCSGTSRSGGQTKKYRRPNGFALANNAMGQQRSQRRSRG